MPKSADGPVARAVVRALPVSRTSIGTAQRYAAGTATAVERTGPAILAALRRRAPHEAARFESELREALDRASIDLDVTRVDEVMALWHKGAFILANPLTEQQQALLARARAGDFAGLRARDENGGWITV